jgi:Ca2+-binding EF-hand superfamily protein
MITGKRILVGVTGILLLAGGIGAGIAATEGAGEGRRHGGWHGRQGPQGGPQGDMGDRMGNWRGRSGGQDTGRSNPRAQLTDEEIDSRIRERFARIDRNSDGVIDRSEVEAMMAAGGRERGMRQAGRGDGRPGDTQAGRMLQRFDENRDGKVTKEEFMTSIKRRFAQMDLDGDGKITEADLPPSLRGSGILTGGGRQASESGENSGGPMGRGARGGGQGGGMGPMISWLRAADTNRDGVITLDEALAHADKQFARLDRNADGVLDQADRDSMRKEMADYRVLRFLHRFDAGKSGKITREEFTKVAKERMASMSDTMGGFDGRGSRGQMGGGRHRDELGFEPRRGRRGADGEPKSGGPAAQPQPGAQPAQPDGAKPARP